MCQNTTHLKYYIIFKARVSFMDLIRFNKKMHAQFFKKFIATSKRYNKHPTETEIAIYRTI